MNRAALLLASGVSFAGALFCTATAQTVPLASRASDTSYAAHIAEAAQRFGIPAAWIRAVLLAESGGDAHAVSPAGATGLMQIMPDTWTELRVRHRLGSDPFDIRDNILAGAAYLRELHDRYGSVAAMLAAYNAGPGRYEASLAGRPLPPETRTYVAALAPMIDDGDAVGLTNIVPARAHPWNDAPLFVAQPERTVSHDPSALAPQPGDLFVALVPTGSVP